MKNVMTLAAAGAIALTAVAPAFAGSYAAPEIAPELVVVEDASSSLGTTGMALLGLALVGGIIAASSDDSSTDD